MCKSVVYTCVLTQTADLSTMNNNSNSIITDPRTNTITMSNNSSNSNSNKSISNNSSRINNGNSNNGSSNTNNGNTNNGNTNTNTESICSKTSNDNNDTATSPTTVEAAPLRLRRNIGLVAAVSYVTGGIIGVGIFVSPQMVLVNTGMSVGIILVVWTFCALISFCGALCYAELGTRIRKSGGSYTYVHAAWGDLAGFVFLWTQLTVVRPAATALGALTVAEYALRPVFLMCPHLIPPLAKTLIALCILWLFVFLNAYSTRTAGYIQTWSTVCKLIALFVIIAVGIVFWVQDGSSNFEDAFTPKDLTVGGVTLAIYSCNYAYMGWDNIAIATEEVKNPRRNIPIAILLGVLLTTIVYVLALVSYYAVLSTSQILSGLAVAALFTEMTVPSLMWLIVPCIAISAAGIVNVIIFTSTRINFIGGRDGLFPEVLMVSVSRKTPTVSCIVLGIRASVVILMSRDIQSVLGAYSLFRASGETAAIMGIWRLRRRFPGFKDTYRAPTAVPLLYLAIHVSLAVMAVTRYTDVTLRHLHHSRPHRHPCLLPVAYAHAHWVRSSEKTE